MSPLLRRFETVRSGFLLDSRISVSVDGPTSFNRRLHDGRSSGGTVLRVGSALSVDFFDLAIVENAFDYALDLVAELARYDSLLGETLDALRSLNEGGCPAWLRPINSISPGAVCINGELCEIGATEHWSGIFFRTPAGDFTARELVKLRSDQKSNPAGEEPQKKASPLRAIGSPAFTTFLAAALKGKPQNLRREGSPLFPIDCRAIRRVKKALGGAEIHASVQVSTYRARSGMGPLLADKSWAKTKPTISVCADCGRGGSEYFLEQDTISIVREIELRSQQMVNVETIAYRLVREWSCDNVKFLTGAGDAFVGVQYSGEVLQVANSNGEFFYIGNRGTWAKKEDVIAVINSKVDEPEPKILLGGTIDGYRLRRLWESGSSTVAA